MCCVPICVIVCFLYKSEISFVHLYQWYNMCGFILMLLIFILRIFMSLSITKTFFLKHICLSNSKRCFNIRANVPIYAGVFSAVYVHDTFQRIFTVLSEGVVHVSVFWLSCLLLRRSVTIIFRNIVHRGISCLSGSVSTFRVHQRGTHRGCQWALVYLIQINQGVMTFVHRLRGQEKCT